MELKELEQQEAHWKKSTTSRCQQRQTKKANDKVKRSKQNLQQKSTSCNKNKIDNKHQHRVQYTKRAEAPRRVGASFVTRLAFSLQCTMASIVNVTNISSAPTDPQEVH